MASKGGGRKRDLAWNDVSDVEGENTQVECNYCGVKVSKKIERVKTHLSKCSKKIKLDKQAKASTSQNQASNAAATLVVDDESSDSDNPPIEQSQSKGLGKFLTKTTIKEKQKLDMQIARFFFGNNISFKTAENQEWLKLIKLLRPGYTPPTRRELAEDLLNKVNEQVQNEIVDQLKNNEKVGGKTTAMTPSLHIVIPQVKSHIFTTSRTVVQTRRIVHIVWNH